jgi:hypothetical protein
MAQRENDKNKGYNQFRKEDLTGKAEQSEAAIEQTERERHNKGADQTRPDLTQQQDELKHRKESRKHSH